MKFNELSSDAHNVLDNGVAKEFEKFVKDYGAKHISFDRFIDIRDAILYLENK